MSEETVITRETITRLLKDVRQIIKNPLTDNGIYYVHDDSDMLKGYAMIVGPSDTPYFGGYYFFEFNYPFDYPFSPPKVKYLTNDGITRFNPNLYKCGKVCVSILNTWNGDKWSSCQTINSILLTLCSLLNEHPFLNEPGQKLESRDCYSYHKIIAFCNIDFAVCELINKSKNKIPNRFEMFYPQMLELFHANYDKLLSIIENKIQSESVECLTVQIYCMSKCIDYPNLKNKLIFVKSVIDAELATKSLK
jgi:ubiquitin-protein ligase